MNCPFILSPDKIKWDVNSSNVICENSDSFQLKVSNKCYVLKFNQKSKSASDPKANNRYSDEENKDGIYKILIDLESIISGSKIHWEDFDTFENYKNGSQDEGSRFIDEVNWEGKEAIIGSSSEECNGMEFLRIYILYFKEHVILNQTILDDNSQGIFKDMNDKKRMFPCLESIEFKNNFKIDSIPTKRIKRILKSAFQTITRFDSSEQNNNSETNIDKLKANIILNYGSKFSDDPLELCDWTIYEEDIQESNQTDQVNHNFLNQKEFSSIREVSHSEYEKDDNSENKSQTVFETNTNFYFDNIIYQGYLYKFEMCGIKQVRRWWILTDSTIWIYKTMPDFSKK